MDYIEYENGDIKYNLYEDGTACVRSANRYKRGTLVIPGIVSYSNHIYRTTRIGWSALKDSWFEHVIIPDGVTTIENYAFSQCSYLKDVRIPDTIMHIGEEAFGRCYALKEIILPQSLHSISRASFWMCRSLQSLSIPDGITAIDHDAFCGCYALQDIKIPNTITYIGWRAFSHCKNPSIRIPKNVRKIGSQFLSHCSNLTSIIVDVENPYYDSRENCNAIIETTSNTIIRGCKHTTIPSSVYSIGSDAFMGMGITSINIPNNIRTIKEWAFAFNSSLTNISIGNQVGSIDYHAFHNCPELVSIIVDSNNTIYDSRENCNAIIETRTNTLIIGCKNSTIPNSVIKIGEYAFWNCKTLSSIIIPEGVTTIGRSAFWECSGLISVIIPKSVITIEDGAFMDCRSLQTIQYNGTSSEWHKISKGRDWHRNIYTTKIKCIDEVNL